MKKIYIASSWRNTLQPDVVRELRAAGHDVYDFRNPPGRVGFRWDAVDPGWRDWTSADYRRALSHPVAQGGFKSDFDAMQWADTCVLVLPCGRSAHLEAGWMVGKGKRVYVLQTSPEEPELMYLMADGICLTSSELLGRLSG